MYYSGLKYETQISLGNYNSCFKTAHYRFVRIFYDMFFRLRLEQNN